MGRISRPEALVGRYVALREVTAGDAAFILALRTSHKARFLHRTENSLAKQTAYLERYLALDDEWYFIVERKGTGEPIGTWRIYNVHPLPGGGTEFESGSWAMVPGSSPQETMEAQLIVLAYAYDVLGFTECVGTVAKGNRRVVRYYARLHGGAMPAEERGDLYVYRSGREGYLYMRDLFAALMD